MLKGDLADFTLPDILRLLALTNKSGRLQLDGDGVSGRVDLADGEVRDASADAGRLPLARRLLGRGVVDGDALREVLTGRVEPPTDLELARELVARQLVGVGDIADVLHEHSVDAVFDLLRWSAGTFRFTALQDDAGAVPAPSIVVEELLAEVEERLARWDPIHERTGPGEAVVTVGRPSAAAVEVDADGWQLLGLADGRRTIDDLSALSGRGQFDTREALVRLMDLGVVAVGAQGEAGSIERLLADHRALALLEAGEAPHAAAEDTTRPAVDEPAAAAADVSAPTPEHADQQMLEDAVVTAVETTTAPDRQDLPAKADVTPLTSARHRLRTDPDVDADLVHRLIDGVEGL